MITDLLRVVAEWARIWAMYGPAAAAQAIDEGWGG